MKCERARTPLDITVIIPTFDRPVLVRETIDSVLAQTVPSSKILLVDNGPFEEQYRETCLAYGSSVTYLRNDPPGTLGARNAGLRQASTEWVAFLDDDDIWNPRFLELAQKAMVDADVDYIGADHVKFEGESRQKLTNFESAPEHYWDGIPRPKVPDAHSIVGRFPIERLLKRIPFYPSSAIMRRELALNVGGFDMKMTGYVSEDIEFLIRVLSVARVAIIWEPMMEYRLHPGSYSRGSVRQEIGRWNVFEYVRAFHRNLDSRFVSALENDLAERRKRIFSVAYEIGDYDTLEVVSKLLRRSDWTFKRRLRLALSRLPQPIADIARKNIVDLTTCFRSKGMLD